MLESERDEWIKEAIVPGTLNPELRAYFLLGLDFPPALDATGFAKWLEEKDG